MLNLVLLMAGSHVFLSTLICVQGNDPTASKDQVSLPLRLNLVGAGLGRLVKLIISKEFEEWLENAENLEIWENVTDNDAVEIEETNNTCV